MKNKSKTLSILITVIGSFFLPVNTFPKSSAEKALDKRNEIIGYLRSLRPMVYNFPCGNYPECGNAGEENQEPGEFIQLYQEIKRVYQEGLIYFFERNFLNAYMRFLDSQRRSEDLLEGLSQVYVDRAEEMLQEAGNKKYSDDMEDMTVIDISIEFGPDSKLRRDFRKPREAPVVSRRYNPRHYNYLEAKYEIEKNMEKGYEHLVLAKNMRVRAVSTAADLAPHESIEPQHRKGRIEYYIRSIEFARQAKRNAEYIFQLKYPFDNYALYNQYGKTEMLDNREAATPELEGICMNWSENPYMVPKDLNPVFDLRLPAEYRVDAVDARNLVHSDEVDVNINFKYDRRERLAGLKEQCDAAEKPAPAAQPDRQTP